MTPETKPPDEPRSAVERLERLRRELEAVRSRGGDPDPGSIRKLVRLTIEAVREESRGGRPEPEGGSDPVDRDRS